MPLFDFLCQKCQFRFETVVQTSEIRSEAPQYPTVQCKKCGNSEVSRLISRFSVGGQGDLRESTADGCHSGFDPKEIYS